jgi:glutaredoxin
MKGGLGSLAAALLLVALPVSAQYRWVDGDGRVNYGDQPPSDARNLTRINTRGGVGDDAAAALPFELRRAMAQYPVTLYTAENCPGCDAARVYLNRRGVPFQEIVLETDEDAAEMKRRVGVDAVPVMTLGRTPTIGFKESTFAAALNAASYPPQSLLPPNWRQPAPQPLLNRPTGPVGQAAAETTVR